MVQDLKATHDRVLKELTEDGKTLVKFSEIEDANLAERLIQSVAASNKIRVKTKQNKQSVSGRVVTES
jgi:hypothetical protein